jgi:transposase-like protein
MEFVPPRCPNTKCKFHTDPVEKFYWRMGYFRSKTRPEPTQRFRCRECNGSFSVQTFRIDYRDRRPEVNAPLAALLTSGVGYRQSARNLRMSHGALQRKAAKLGRAMGRMHMNQLFGLPAGRTYILDEEETYEKASIRPLTVPLMVESDSWFVIDAAVAPIRRLARPGSRRRKRQDADEQVNGRRSDQSREAVAKVLGTLAPATGRGKLRLISDKKSSYPRLARKAFGEDLLEHKVVSSKALRDTSNPLFPINLTIAMSRDNMGRLRRRSWLVTKLAERLLRHLYMYLVYRNYIRRRFNRDEIYESPAQKLGLMPRNLEFHEVLRWRQDWGERSIHPLSEDAKQTVRTRLTAPVAVATVS